ncbi:MAG: hypothetical protein CO187_10965 [Zetaproteobacteria bacterium CG_4_9_14_3_um_filter_53_7]|nr:MAG: hypothetical protein CO187_10965 [Zetaproteobacteria bacterium CG_4_9_14_3_um_filter_53_7]
MVGKLTMLTTPLQGGSPCSECAANDHQVSDAASAAAQAENSRLKAEAAALRKAVDEQRAVLDAPAALNSFVNLCRKGE